MESQAEGKSLQGAQTVAPLTGERAEGTGTGAARGYMCLQEFSWIRFSDEVGSKIIICE